MVRDLLVRAPDGELSLELESLEVLDHGGGGGSLDFDSGGSHLQLLLLVVMGVRHLVSQELLRMMSLVMLLDGNQPEA